MLIKQATYLTSVVDKEKLISDEKPEFAFVGRSNVGKSSIINNLTGKKKLAKTSSSPGHTRMINYFEINGGQFRFVDLPGYGFHKAGKKNQSMWAELIESYLTSSECLKTVFMLVDSRIEPTELDKIMCKFLIQTGRNFVVIATKADKLSRAKQNQAKKQIASALGIRDDIIIFHSSLNSQGKEQILNYIENLI